MIEHPTLVEAEARVRRTEALARSRTFRPPHLPHRHRLAQQLRRVADRLEG